MTESLAHPVFGDLRWEEKFSWWFTQLRQQSGEWMDVIVDPGDHDPSPFVERAAQLYRQAMDAERELLRQAIEKGLLDLCEHWRQEDELRLTAEELKNWLELTFVRLDTITPITLNY
jgi:hypothetical protein